MRSKRAKNWRNDWNSKKKKFQKKILVRLPCPAPVWLSSLEKKLLRVIRYNPRLARNTRPPDHYYGDQGCLTKRERANQECNRSSAATAQLNRCAENTDDNKFCFGTLKGASQAQLCSCKNNYWNLWRLTIVSRGKDFHSLAEMLKTLDSTRKELLVGLLD